MPKKLNAVQIDRQREEKYNKFKSITHKWWMSYEDFKNDKNYDWESAILQGSISFFFSNTINGHRCHMRCLARFVFDAILVET